MPIKIILYFALLLLPNLSFAQRAKISFEKNTMNVGTIAENGGKITCKYKFTNKGKVPLLIKHIETSCGCTTPKWNRKPILPGESDVITVIFNPKDRSGMFSKKITVYTNATPPNAVLRLEGEVAAQETDWNKSYPISIGDLCMSTDTIFLKQVKAEQQVINLLNRGKKKISITAILKPDYLEADCTPLSLSQGMNGNLIIRFRPRHADKIKPTDHLLIQTDRGTNFKFIISDK